MSVEATIREKLVQALQPTRLDIVNESHLHAGHRNSPGTGESHFRVLVVSAIFAGKSRLARHRLVNEALAAELKTKVHALAIRPTRPAKRSTGRTAGAAGAHVHSGRDLAREESLHRLAREHRARRTLAPMARTRIRVSLPSRTFLSWPMIFMSEAASGVGSPGMSAMRVGSPTAAKWAATRCTLAASDKPQLLAQPERQADADGHGLAVQQPLRVPRPGLERMAEGVAQVEQHAVAGLGLVACDDGGLALDAGADERAPSASASCASTACQFCSSQPKNAASPSRPYLAAST